MTALREIRDLFLLRGFLVMIDTTDQPDVLAAKVHKRLSRELFSFAIQSNPAFQGMEHLAKELTESSGITTME